MIAALQDGLAAAIATLGWVIVVGAGGGLIKPLQQRWEGHLSTAGAQAPTVEAQVEKAPSITDQAKQAKDQASGGDRHERGSRNLDGAGSHHT